MNYRVNSKNKDKLSILGYGCMRFTKQGNKIDYKKAEMEIRTAIDSGINYFDTAYIYPGSEAVLGKILEGPQRSKVNIATKLPHYLIKRPEDIEKYFTEQLRRLNTSWIDYYLMHMLPDINTWSRLKELGIEKWIENKKQSGEIRNIGFSFHGNTQNFIELLDNYQWDFCQIQFNYMDEYRQAGIDGLRYAGKKGIPVIVMEPLRGGKLVNNLPAPVKKIWEQAKEQRSPAEWALRWVWNHPEVTVVLSGMNSMEQIKENVRIASEAQADMLTKKELALFFNARSAMEQIIKVPCTGCGYCMPCPSGVDVPSCFHAYNAKYTDNTFTGLREYLFFTTLKKIPSNASKCIRCGKCETHCPQKIEIRRELKNVVKYMETPVYKLAKFAVKKIGKF